jgi:hypothetical protein
MLAEISDKFFSTNDIILFVFMSSIICCLMSLFRSWMPLLGSFIVVIIIGYYTYLVVDKDLKSALISERGSLNYRYAYFVCLLIPLFVGVTSKFYMKRKNKS